MNVLGLMSGTSLDGLDMALVRFSDAGKFDYEFIACKTVVYSDEWKTKLSNALYSAPEEIDKLDQLYGIWLGEQVLAFRDEFKYRIDLIGSHGHTVFHRPHEAYTLQIGSGKEIHHLTGIPVVCNFRQQDVALGGQGAPLVPIGDALLFSEFDFCLNLGGFSNISWEMQGQRKACDICPCNMLLNSLSHCLGKDFDEGGKWAQQGSVIPEILMQWNALNYYHLPFPKSLGREWFEIHFKNDLNSTTYRIEDLLRTAVEHIALQIHRFIASQIPRIPLKKRPSILCTGGGAFNDFLMASLREACHSEWEYIIPSAELIEYKEALVFALLAYLKWNGVNNVLSSVTGASHDHSSGDVYKDFSHKTGGERLKGGK